MASGGKTDGQGAVRPAPKRAGPTMGKTGGKPMGKTRWERMQMSELALEQLATILMTAKASEGKSAKTIAWYQQAVRDYCGWLGREGLPQTLGGFTLERVRAYTVDLQRRAAFEHHPALPTRAHRLSDASVNSYLRALRAFSNWLYTEGYTSEHTLARLKTPRLAEKVKDILTPDEIVRIVGSLNPRTEIGARDQAIFLLLLDTGMRLSELCTLRLANVRLAEGYALVYGKGKKQRPVRVGALAAKALRFYVAHWRSPARPSIDAVFLTCRGVTRYAGTLAPEAGEPLKPKAVELMIKRIGRAADVPRLHPHLLRHTFSCRYLLKHRDPFALKSLLGHTTLAMTNHYCAAVEQMEIVRAERDSVLDDLDLGALRINRRGRLRKPVGKPETTTEKEENQ